jgi:hypothetical protein
MSSVVLSGDNTDTAGDKEAPASLDSMAGFSTPGKLSQLPHDPLFFLLSISLGWMVG